MFRMPLRSGNNLKFPPSRLSHPAALLGFFRLCIRRRPEAATASLAVNGEKS